MPLANKQARQHYLNEYRKRKRRERGLMKSGRKPLCGEAKIAALEKRKQWELSWKKVYSENHPVKRLIWAARRRAKNKNQDFNITEEDINIPTHCPYLGIELVTSSPRGTSRESTMSLDRIDTSKGYIKGNVEVISHLANTMKNCATNEQLLQFANVIKQRLDPLYRR